MPLVNGVDWGGLFVGDSGIPREGTVWAGELADEASQASAKAKTQTLCVQRFKNNPVFIFDFNMGEMSMSCLARTNLAGIREKEMADAAATTN